MSLIQRPKFTRVGMLETSRQCPASPASLQAARYNIHIERRMMAEHRQSTNTLKPHVSTLDYDQTCFSLLVMSCECPICHNVVKPPSKMCLNGHLCCMQCVLGKPTCPDCQERFSCARLAVVERILKVLGRACSHARYGCRLFLNSECQRDHERYCGWRRVQCLWCPSAVGVNKWAEHLVKSHGPHALTYETEGFETIPLGTEVCKTLFYMNGVLYCLYSTRGEDNDNGSLYVTLQCFPTSAEDLDSVFEASIQNKGLYFCQSIHPVTDSVKRRDVFKDVDKCIIIPRYLLKQKEFFAFKITLPKKVNNNTPKTGKAAQYEKPKMSF